MWDVSNFDIQPADKKSKSIVTKDGDDEKEPVSTAATAVA